MKVNRYTTDVLQPRQVAQQVNPRAVDDAGAISGFAC